METPIHHRGDRLILADASSADEVVFFARGAEFQEGRENNTPYGSERVWVIRKGLYFHYVDNRQADVRYVQVTGDDAEDVQRFTELAGEFFTTVGVDALLSDVREARTPQERARTLTRLAVGLPNPASEEALQEILTAFDDEDAAARRAALLSALYLDWEIVGPSVRRMEQFDDEDMLRVQAQYFVDRHDRSEGNS
ncbi:hypothetical protein [Streptomyces sp. HUAS ZL42]|uniref:hypothetical protein n=1 Tax=Streptomyces sp. HUAS ZL42 TaxID=3231715 RepID=UPI00345E51CB